MVNRISFFFFFSKICKTVLAVFCALEVIGVAFEPASSSVKERCEKGIWCKVTWSSRLFHIWQAGSEHQLHSQEHLSKSRKSTQQYMTLLCDLVEQFLELHVSIFHLACLQQTDDANVESSSAMWFLDLKASYCNYCTSFWQNDFLKRINLLDAFGGTNVVLWDWY